MGAHLSSRQLSTATALAALLGFGMVLAACGSSSPSAAPTTTTTASRTTTTTAAGSSTTTTTTGSGSASSEIRALSSLSGSGSTATFQATYTYTDAGRQQTMEFAQSPPKSLFKESASDGLAVDTGTATYYCGAGTCYKTGTVDPLASLFFLFDGKTFQDTVSAYAVDSAYLAAHGISLAFSTGTYAGQASKCVTITQSSAAVKTATWCVADNGIMTSFKAGTSSFSLTSFTASPPSSDFALPPGATITTLP